MLKKSYILIILLSVVFTTVNGQLITDSQNKLKTAPSDKANFFQRLFSSKKTSATEDSKPSSSKKGVSPKYSNAASPFKGIKNVSPRFSKITRKGGNYKARSPRYSAGSPFKGKKYFVYHEYSKGSPFRNKDFNVSPRYSPSNPFRGADYKVYPRYSPPNPFRGADYKVYPRYSPPNPFRGSDFKVYPRYSQGSPFRGQDYDVNPRYSPSNPFRGADYKVSPRYSLGSPFKGQKFRVKPRFSGTKKRSLNQKEKQDLKHYNYMTTSYRGDWKYGKIKEGNQHPSANSHGAKKYTSETVRNSLRKWNVFWVRLNSGNKLTPKGVKKEPKKAKFDKKERTLWNN